MTQDPDLGSLMSNDSLELECETSDDESLDDTIKEVTEDLNDIMVEVEKLKRSSGNYDSNGELQNMIRVSERKTMQKISSKMQNFRMLGR